MLRRRIRHALDRARTFLGLPPAHREPLTEDERTPLAGTGTLHDPGHLPESMRAPCGRPPPGAPPAPASSDTPEEPRP